MFGKLKDKLKGAFKKFSKDIENEAEDIVEPALDVKAEKEEKKVAPKKEKSETKPKKEPVKKEPIKEKVKEVKKEKKSESKPKSTPEFVEKKVETVEVKEEPESNVKEISEEDFEKEIEEPKKKGLFQKLFSKKDQEEIQELEKEEVEVLENEVAAIKEEKDVKEDFEKLPAEEKVEVLDDKKLVEEEISEEIKEEEKIVEEIEEKKKGIFSKVKDSITKKKISEEKFEELFFEIEVALLESNVSFDVVQKIKDDLKEELVNNPIPRGEIMNVIMSTLRSSIESLFEIEGVNLIKKSEEKSPLIISFIGVNGSGKTTQLAKLAKKFQDAGKSVVIGACDTFRAAAIHQLEEHANNLNIKMIKHDYGADAAAVAFDTISHAKSKGIDVVLLDTAGRLHSNTDLMRELEKLMKISNPDFNVFVGESITGNDCVEQATLFGESVRIDGIILTKADVDDKGGAALSVSYVTKKPILYFGTGQGYDDLIPFTKELVLNNLGLD